ncbi:MAG: hypothetical protein IJ306_06805 [Oscillospiraceae bacterium]|nr:hypothetical protein [Oscillospiraceae bacterium]
MENIKILNTKIKELFGKKQSKKAMFILLLGFIGMLLIYLSEFIPEDGENIETASGESCFSVSEREDELEKKLAGILSKISGAGETSVMLTFASSKEYFYAENFSEDRDDTENSTESEIVIIDGENGEKPIVLKTAEAEIRGVLVICEGGENAVVREKIIEALCALLDIPSNRVSVAKMA